MSLDIHSIIYCYAPFNKSGQRSRVETKTIIEVFYVVHLQMVYYCRLREKELRLMRISSVTILLSWSRSLQRNAYHQFASTAKY